jgi:signal transduction histidine kinase
MYKALVLSLAYTSSSPPAWPVIVILLGAAACCCFLLARRRPDADDGSRRVPRFSRHELRTAGWAAGLLVLAVSVAVAVTSGNAGPPTQVAVVALWLVIACAPARVRPLLPFAAVGVGLAGLVAAVLAQRNTGLLLGGLAPRFDVWRVSLLVQSAAFILVGLWLIRRERSDGPLLPAGPGGRPDWRWAVLLLPTAALLALLISRQPGHLAWIAAAAAAALALILVLALPAAAPDLAAAGLAVLGLAALSYVLTPPTQILHRASAPARFSVSPAPLGGPAGQPIHWWVVSNGAGALELVAGLQGAAILAFGIWLIPRTIGVRARTLLHPDTELAGRVEQLTQTRANAVDTAAAELRRVERDLHDGAQARLVALGMSLRAAERLITTSPQAAIELVAEAREASSKALTELRDLVRGMYPPVLADRGLADAVRALALDTPLRTETDIDLPGRLDLPVESACYFAIAEALTNAVKHSGARLVQIRIQHASRPAPGVLRIEVTDNGAGGADPARGSGLQGVERRLATFDGILAVSSPPGGPTMIVMEIPCALSSPRTSSC